MKIQIILLLTIMFFSFLQSQHVPPCDGKRHGEDDAGSICWGYAMGRAFDAEWGSNPCSASTLKNFSKIDDTFFDLTSGVYYTHYNLKKGDIVTWGLSHVAYVESVDDPIIGEQSIHISQVEQSGQRTFHTGTLKDVRDGDDSKGILARGAPTGYYRKSKPWKITARNEFSDISSVGIVKINNEEGESPFTKTGFSWKDAAYLSAPLANTKQGDYYLRLTNWSNPVYGTKNGVQVYHVLSNNNPFENPIWTANLRKEFNVNLQTNYTGLSLKVNGNIFPVPYEDHVLENGTTTVEASNQMINAVEYIFSNWSTGNYSNIQILAPTDHSILTAYFIAQPLQTPNVRVNNRVGDNIRVSWDEHFSPEVTKYEVWRKVKNSITGVIGPLVHLATLPRGTTSYTDPEYIITNGYTNSLIQYNIRSYHQPTNTYSLPKWISQFGESGGGGGVEDFQLTDGYFQNQFSISNYPNPFNPTTTFSIRISEPSKVSLIIYDIAGRKVSEILDETFGVGTFSIPWNINRVGVLSSGHYYYKFTAKPISGASVFVKNGKLLFAK